jgi:hypothetical protein
MRFISQVRKITLAAGAVTLATGAAIAGTAGAASAATPHTLKICAYGNYWAFAQLPGGREGFPAAPGHCKSIGVGSGISSAEIYGLYNSGNHGKFYVGTAHFSASKGWSGAAEGKTTSHSLLKF